MGDLQSPQYVKRTAHMFDLKVNGSNTDDDHHRNGDETLHQHKNQPSYLNVSRSVCGYSCLSYNNGTTSSTITTSNGVSSSNCKPLRPSGVHSDFQLIGYRPKATTTTTTTFQTNNFNKSDSKNNTASNNGNRENTLNSKSGIISTEIENNHSTSASYTQARCTSNILEKIERLYGSNAVSNTALWRRPVPLMNHQISPQTAIPPSSNNNITILNENVVISNNNNKTGKGEKIIPILLEGSIGQQQQQQKQTSISVKSPTFKPVKHSSSIDSSSDKVDLYSNQDILNANQRQKKLQQPQQEYNGKVVKAAEPYDANQSLVTQDLHIVKRTKDYNEEGEENYNSSITPTISRTKSHSSKLNGNNSASDQQQRNFKVTQDITINLKSPIKTQNDFTIIPQDSSNKSLTTEKEVTMVSDTTNKKIIPTTTTTHVKTEDIVDGELLKPAFKNVCNLNSDEMEDKTNNIRILPTSSLTSEKEKENDSNDENLLDLKENICCGGEPKIVEKDGEYFKAIIQKEKSHIESLIKTAESRLETLDTSEESEDYELSGKILAAIGKARLLVNKKFKQFEGLCNDNIEQRKKGVGSDEPYTTKNEDLEGFWDMVLLQVDQIHSMFQNFDSKEGPRATKNTKIASTRKAEPAKKATSSKASSGKVTSPGASTTRDEIRRKMLNERRKAMKQTGQDAISTDIQIFIPDTSSQE